MRYHTKKNLKKRFKKKKTKRKLSHRKKGGSNYLNLYISEPLVIKYEIKVDNSNNKINKYENKRTSNLLNNICPNNVCTAPYYKLFKNDNDLEEHYLYMRNLSIKNNWKFFNNPPNYGSCFYIKKDGNKNKYLIKKDILISDIMKVWETESLSIECKAALPIFWLLKLWRKYKDNVNKIIKTIVCEICDKTLDNFTAKNFNNQRLFHRYNIKSYLPQKDRILTKTLINEINECHFAYLRSAFGYITFKDLRKLNIRHNIPTADQGHNIFLFNNNIGVFGLINAYGDNSKINTDDKNGIYLKYNDDNNEDKYNRQEWLDLCYQRSINAIQKNQNTPKNDKVPTEYKVCDQNTKYKFNDWYGLIDTYNIAYLLPNEFKSSLI